MITEEISVVVKFLTKLDSHVFKQVTWDSVMVTDPRELLLFASLVPRSFFLHKNASTGDLEPYNVRLPLDFCNSWARDLEEEYEDIFSPKTDKMLCFVPYWVATWVSNEAYERKRMREVLSRLEKNLDQLRKPPSEVLFVPYFEYSAGVDLGEGFYHYLIGTVLKESGYLVCDEYVLSKYDGQRPDLSAFKTEELRDDLQELFKERIITSGAFLQELQLYCLFGKHKGLRARSYGPLRKNLFTDAVGSVAVEIERTGNRRSGSIQLMEYLIGTQGLYDEGYLAGPFLDSDTKGIISFDEEGELVFSRSEPAFKPESLSEHLRIQREDQLNDVILEMKLQLMKNFRLERIVNLCGSSSDWRSGSYLELIGRINSLDLGEIIDLLVDRE